MSATHDEIQSDLHITPADSLVYPNRPAAPAMALQQHKAHPNAPNCALDGLSGDWRDFESENWTLLHPRGPQPLSFLRQQISGIKGSASRRSLDHHKSDRGPYTGDRSSILDPGLDGGLYCPRCAFEKLYFLFCCYLLICYLHVPGCCSDMLFVFGLLYMKSIAIVSRFVDVSLILTHIARAQ